MVIAIAITVFVDGARPSRESGGSMTTTQSHPETEIESAARVLIGLVRKTEHAENSRSSGAELSLEVSLIGGGTETWTITIERTASSH